MAPQPSNFDRLSTRFGAIAEETEKMPSPAAMHESQTLNTSNVLAEIRQSVNTIPTEMASLRTHVIPLRTDVTTLCTDVTNLRTDMNTNVANLQTDFNALRACSTNRLDTSEVNMQARFQSPRVRIPLGVLRQLQTTNVDSLLTAYNLPTHGTLAEKRRRFVVFIGL